MYIHRNSTTAVFYLVKTEPKEGEMAMMKLKSVLIACTLLFFICFIIGCLCETDETCQDENWCNGVEVCSNPIGNPVGVCIPGPPRCKSGICDEDNQRCMCWTYEDCEDGDLCTLDQCLVPDQRCFSLPVECFDGKECNPDNGLCEYL